MRAHLLATSTLLAIIGICSLFIFFPTAGFILSGVVALVACYVNFYYGFKE